MGAGVRAGSLFHGEKQMTDEVETILPAEPVQATPPPNAEPAAEPKKRGGRPPNVKKVKTQAEQPVPTKLAEPVIMIRVRINRDTWIKDEVTGEVVRNREGTEIDVPLEQALNGIESGALSRVKS